VAAGAIAAAGCAAIASARRDRRRNGPRLFTLGQCRARRV